MRVFRVVGRMVLRHRYLVLLYVVMLACFGFLMAGSVGGTAGSYVEARPTVAVIDRDGSAVSRAVAEVALSGGKQVELPDTAYALQDAAAKGLASYVLVIPEGYGDALVAAAREGGEPPALETVTSYQETSAVLMDERVRGCAQQIFALLSETDASVEEAVAWSEEARTSGTEVSLIETEATGIPVSYLVFMQFSTYALFGSVGILVASGLRSLGRDQAARQRLLVAPVGTAAWGAQVVLACLAVGVFVWAALGVLGMLWCRDDLAGVDANLVLLAQLPLLALALVGAAFGYLLWELGASSDVTHAAGNIGSMVLTFLGGTWVQQASMGAAVAAVGRATPVWWVVSALARVYEATALTTNLMTEVAASCGVVLLFAAAIAVAGAAIGQARSRA